MRTLHQQPRWWLLADALEVGEVRRRILEFTVCFRASSRARMRGTRNARCMIEHRRPHTAAAASSIELSRAHRFDVLTHYWRTSGPRPWHEARGSLSPAWGRAAAP